MTVVEELKHAAQTRWRAILNDVGIPADSLDGKHHPCPKCGGTDRFRLIDASTGAVLCNQCFRKDNGDGIAAIRWMTGATFPEALKIVGDHVGIETNGAAKMASLFSSAQEALDACGLGTPAVCHYYRDAGGECVGLVARFNGPEFKGGKSYRPISRVDGGWKCGAMPEPQPLYRLIDVIDAEVIHVFEGEKCVDAVEFMEINATTNAGGSGALKKANWQALAGKRVFVHPDNDKPGLEWRDKLAEILRTHDCDAIPCDPLSDIPGGDVVDWLDAHDAVEPETLRERIEAMTAATDHSPQEEPRESYERFYLQDAAEFLNEHFPVRWWIENIFRRDAPTTIFGPSKSLKTSIAIDLAVSIATAGKFLNVWQLHEQGRAGYVSGEIVGADLQLLLRVVAESKRIETEEIRGRLFMEREGHVPKFGQPLWDASLVKHIEANRLDILFVDPAYFAMQDADAARLNEMGSKLQSTWQVIKRTGCQLAIIHHTVKSTAKPTKDLPEISDMTGSGYAEWTRQWIGLNRRKPYDHDSKPGWHQLNCSIGAFRSGWAGVLELDEGSMSRPTWDVVKRTRRDVEADEDRQKAKDAERKDDAASFATVTYLRENGGWHSYRALTRAGLGFGDSDRGRRILNSLVKDGKVERADMTFNGKDGIGYRAVTLPSGVERQGTDENESTTDDIWT